MTFNLYLGSGKFMPLSLKPDYVADDRGSGKASLVNELVS